MMNWSVPYLLLDVSYLGKLIASWMTRILGSTIGDFFHVLQIIQYFRILKYLTITNGSALKCYLRHVLLKTFAI
jgi:hypothetical protein